MRVEETGVFRRWMAGLRNREALLRIVRQIERIQKAGRYVGDWKPVGEGVMETRLAFGPGYRIYSSIEHGCLLLLLAGGDKSGQREDIEKAKQQLEEWRNQHGNL